MEASDDLSKTTSIMIIWLSFHFEANSTLGYSTSNQNQICALNNSVLRREIPIVTCPQGIRQTGYCHCCYVITGKKYVVTSLVGPRRLCISVCEQREKQRLIVGDKQRENKTRLNSRSGGDLVLASLGRICWQ